VTRRSASSCGTIVNILCSNNVLGDVERMVEDLAKSLVGFNDRINWQEFVARWRA